MIDRRDMEQKTSALQHLLEERLGVRGRDLPQALRRAGRRLPRHIRRKAGVVQRSAHLAGHPKVARQISRDEVTRAYAQVTAHLRGIDPAERRKTRLLRLAAAIAFNLIVVSVGFIAYLWWRGYL